MGGGARAAAAGRVTATLRRAVASDLDAIVAIERASFSDAWTPGSFRSLLSASHVYFPVVEAGAAVAGYAVALFAADEGELANIAVADAHRGQGLGAQLLDAVLAEAASRGTRTTWLEVRESNAAARRLYAGRGFVESGRRRKYYDAPVEDALVYRRDA